RRSPMPNRELHHVVGHDRTNRMPGTLLRTQLPAQVIQGSLRPLRWDTVSDLRTRNAVLTKVATEPGVSMQMLKSMKPPVRVERSGPFSNWYLYKTIFRFATDGTLAESRSGPSSTEDFNLLTSSRGVSSFNFMSASHFYAFSFSNTLYSLSAEDLGIYTIEFPEIENSTLFCRLNRRGKR
ncbi:hypothetical protein, partial [uncultured Sphingomonas sp.]|uniref:hypothetical protein n=1 Tax=uncultured Sphingomonas sp. TaxID=158754 RepID=UPI0035CBB1A0